MKPTEKPVATHSYTLISRDRYRVDDLIHGNSTLIDLADFGEKYQTIDETTCRMIQGVEFIKYNTGKTRWSLLPWHILDGIARVYTWGAEKYGDDNWKKAENGRDVFFDAMMRHYKALVSGETNDKETGIHHAYHFAWNALAVAWYVTR